MRYNPHQDDELVALLNLAEKRFAAWLSSQEERGTAFTMEQVQWLTWMKENVAGVEGVGGDWLRR